MDMSIQRDGLKAIRLSAGTICDSKEDVPQVIQSVERIVICHEFIPNKKTFCQILG